jgi:arabinose-5-phosphate isomerase
MIVGIKTDLLNVLRLEADAIKKVIDEFPDEAVGLVKQILQTSGRVVFSGMGKSGHIARKLVATFSSMGTPALFLHPSEALHGDLGMVNSDDLFIALSKSGTGSELAQVINVLKLQKNRTALICCSRGALGSIVDLVVQLPFEREACDMNLAPTSSSTLMIAFGDAVSVAVSKVRGFEQNDFARTHPAGSLGKRLLSTVQMFMYEKDELPFVSPDTTFQEVILRATEKKLGVAIVADKERRLRGIITDGDLRRSCEHGAKLFSKKAHDIMSKNPKVIAADAKAYSALEIMEQFNITSLLVVEKDVVVGLVHIHDLVKAGIKR